LEVPGKAWTIHSPVLLQGFQDLKAFFALSGNDFQAVFDVLLQFAVVSFGERVEVVGSGSRGKSWDQSKVPE
jgi:hypothetical protein